MRLAELALNPEMGHNPVDRILTGRNLVGRILMDRSLVEVLQLPRLPHRLLQHS